MCQEVQGLPSNCPTLLTMSPDVLRSGRGTIKVANAAS